MRQTINLLSKRRTQRGMLWWTVLGLTICFIGLVGWGGLTQFQLIQQQATLLQAEQKAQNLRTELLAKKRALGLQEAQNQDAELTRLRSQLNAQREWVDWIQKGELGQATGPSEVLTTLATVRTEGLWLDRVELIKGGPSVVLSGSAFNLASVVAYAQQLDPQLRDNGPFLAIETTQDVLQSNDDGSAKTTVIRFKLY